MWSKAMRSEFRNALSAAIIVALATAASPLAFAETTGAQSQANQGPAADCPNWPRMPGYRMGMGRNSGQIMGMMQSHVEGRMAALKSELKITDAQSKLWSDFASAMTGAAATMRGMYSETAQNGFNGSLPDRLDRMETHMSAHIAAIEAVKAALAPLYASFTDDQKKRADRILVGPMGMM
jgi:hypothetical protein